MPGKPGPKPRPEHLRVVHGSGNKNAPVAMGIPIKPDCLSSGAAKVWDRLMPELLKMEVLAKIDRDSLELLCEHKAAAINAKRLMDKHGILIKGRMGDIVKNPACQIFKDNSQSYYKLMVEFGLTPSARAGLHVPKPEKGEKKKRFFN